MKIKKAIIPAAGFGTRFLPITKSIPKEMLPILDKPSIHYVVEEAILSGIKDIAIIISRGKNSIENYFDISYELEDFLFKKGKKDLLKKIKFYDHNDINIYFIRQKIAKGLGDAIYCAKSFIGNDSFAVLLPDDLFVKTNTPCLKQLIEQYEYFNSSIFTIMKVLKKDINKYGIIKGENINKNIFLIKDLIEKPEPDKAPSNYAIMGRYVFTSKIFEMIKNTNTGKGGEIQITDAMKKLLFKEKIYGYIFKGERHDIGNLLGYLKATIDFSLSRKDIKNEFKNIIKKYIKF